MEGEPSILSHGKKKNSNSASLLSLDGDTSILSVSQSRLPAPTSRAVCMNLFFFFWLKAICSYDSGAFSAALGSAGGMAETWSLTLTQQGALTSSVYLGNIFGCLLAGKLLSSYSARGVLIRALFIHTIFTVVFALIENYHAALISRFVIGGSLAFVVVYTPVWVDEFAPRERKSVWMAFQNVGVPLGVIMGYLASAIALSHTHLSWAWAFYVKGAMMVPTLGYLTRVDVRSIDVGRSAEASVSSVHPIGGQPAARGGETSAVALGAVPAHSYAAHFLVRLRQDLLSMWSTTQTLVVNRIFICSALSMSFLYFISAGLQNFVTPYLRGEPFNASMSLIMASFGTSVVTAPICGVVIGGLLLDACGGYTGDLRRVALFATGWGIVAAIFSVFCIFATTTVGFLLTISVVLFCGGATVPPVLGLTMVSLPTTLRPAGAAFSQVLYNLLGNFGGPLLCGVVADRTGSLRYGIATILSSSALGVAPLGVVLFLAFRRPTQAPLGGAPWEKMVVECTEVARTLKSSDDGGASKL